MKQRVIDLSDPYELESVSDHEGEILSHLCNLLKLGTPIADLVKKGSFGNLTEAVYESFSQKFNTKFLYVEESKDGKYENPHPYYAVHPLTVEDWFILVKDYMTINCSDLFEFVESHEEVTPTNVAYGTMLYKFKGIQDDAGIVFYHYSSESSTIVRMYINVDGMTYYMPYRVFSKSSGRYNRMTKNEYPESIKMMILSLQSIDMDDIQNTVFLQKKVIEERKSKILSVEEITTLLSKCGSEAPEELTQICSDLYSEEPDRMNDLLWRYTNLNKTLGDVLSMFKKPIESTEARIYLGQLAYDTLVCDRLYRVE